MVYSVVAMWQVWQWMKQARDDNFSNQLAILELTVKNASGILLGKYAISTASTTGDATITVTLNGVDINHHYPISIHAPGINCQGSINLVLADGSVNYITASIAGYAGIFITGSRTLTVPAAISSLTAQPPSRPRAASMPRASAADEAPIAVLRVFAAPSPSRATSPASSPRRVTIQK